MQIFRVVLLARSCATIPRDEQVRLPGWPSPYGDLAIRLRTYNDDPGIGAVVPILLVAEVEGPCDSLDRALRAFADGAHSAVALLAVAINVAIDAPTLERGYQSSPNSPYRPFYQNLAPAVGENARRARVVDCKAAEEVLATVARNGGRERVLRAARQYRLALSYWEPGNETLALAHLYMGVEAITETLLRLEMARLGTTQEQLADQWGLTAKERERLKSSLLSHARSRLVFQGDAQTYKSAREASDGFEHGYSSLEAVDASARQARVRTAACLRETILRAAGLDAESLKRLLAPPFDFPVHGGPDTHEAWANFHGDGDLAPPGAHHPGIAMGWLPTTSRRSDGKIEVRQDAIGEWELAPGIIARDFRIDSAAPPVDAVGSDTQPVAAGLWRLPPRAP